MKTVKIHPKNFFLNVRGLIVIYLLLCILTVLFSRMYFIETLEGGAVPEALPFFVFITIPLALLAFLGVSVVRLVRESIGKKTGARFQIRLLAYFLVIVTFAAVPVTVITTQAIYVIVRYWRSIHLETALDGAEKFTMDLYGLQLERCESLVRARAARIDALMAAAAPGGGAGALDGAEGSRPRSVAALAAAAGTEEVLAVQDFRLSPEGVWQAGAFAGAVGQELLDPPALQAGFAPREMPRDRDVIRYVLAVPAGTAGMIGTAGITAAGAAGTAGTAGTAAERLPNQVRVVSYHLGDGFDGTVAALGGEKTRFVRINDLGVNLKTLLIFYYGMFFFPTLLMTAIIAISFTRRVTQPIVELTEATRRVAEGDFSTQILVRQGDEFGPLVQSFNAMVRDFQKSQNALVKAEKISLWQSMAQQLAHEIKNPLTPIKLSAERVLRRWRNEPERVGEILEASMMAIVQEVQGLSHMLTEFRTLARPLEPSQTWTALKPAIEEIIAPFITPYPNVRFDLDHVDGTLEVRIESHHLGQVLTNLIINSIDAMTSGAIAPNEPFLSANGPEGRMTSGAIAPNEPFLSANGPEGRMNTEGTIEFRTDVVKKRESRYCRLSVRDTGKGITAAEREKVFAPYFTTKDTGTGLGLPIVERIVNDHGGSIWLNSAEGAGTTFYIDFPLDGAAAGILAATDTEGAPTEPAAGAAAVETGGDPA
jgi:nitrogen fixation/metabolism regulation signal transduction histidine kinase